MIVGQVVRETLALKRALECEHEWATHSTTEEQCKRCLVIATAEGKATLARMAAKRLVGGRL